MTMTQFTSRLTVPSQVVSPAWHPETAPHQHLVGFYDSEEFLVALVADFAGEALHEGDGVIVVATPEHRSAFEAALSSSGVDLAGAVTTGRYLALDAAECLERFMAEGAPDPVRFDDMVCGALERTAAGGCRVRIYGEMVALLWDAGDLTSAIALEDLWNDLAAEVEFTLLCAYPTCAFEDLDSGTSYRRICNQHSAVIPCEEHAMLGGADDQQRAVALIQQETMAPRAQQSRVGADRVVTEIACDETLSAGARRHEPGDRRVVQPGVRPATAGHAPPNAHLHDSPGGRLLVDSLGTLSSRLRYSRPN